MPRPVPARALQPDRRCYPLPTSPRPDIIITPAGSSDDTDQGVRLSAGARRIISQRHAHNLAGSPHIAFGAAVPARRNPLTRP